MKSAFLALSFFLIPLLMMGCAPTKNLQPDEVLLNESKNDLGEPPPNLEALTKAPVDKPFRLREVERLEELITSSQTSRAQSRQAVFVGEEETPLLNGPFPKALESGQTINPKENIEIFWPQDVVNDYLKIKNKDGGTSWVKYKNSTSQPQIILLEDFIIPQVQIKDSRLIVITKEENGDNDIKPDVDPIVVSDEEIKGISYDTETAPTEGEAQPEDGELIPATETDVETTPETSVEVTTDTSTATPEITIETEPEVLPLEQEEPSSSAPEASIRPVARPPKPTTKPPPSLDASGLSSQQLLDSLGIKETSIPEESKYLREGQRKISEVFPRAYKNFSACTFNPAQGSKKSRCYRELILSEEFTDFLESKGQSCAEQASQLVFEKKPIKVLLRTNGGSLNRPSANSNSLHYRGRALDVFKIFLYFAPGSDPKEMVFHKNNVDGSSKIERQNYNFYWAFESCWKKEVQQHHKTRACGGKGSGALTYKFNSDHDNHMHISLPVCRSVKKQFNLNST